jgi:hypothetical protein
VLYLMHGAGEDERYWLSEERMGKPTCAVLDYMMDKGEMEPAIVVSSTVNAGREPGTEAVHHQYSDTAAQQPSEVPENPTRAANLSVYPIELRNDIIPLIETKYATFTKGDVSGENLQATRAHRAFAGFSMGSMTTIFSAWDGCFDYFAYIGNLSGMDPYDVGIVESILAKMGEGGVYEGLKMKYWYNGNGTEDTAEPDHLRNYAKMLELGGSIWQEGEHYEQGDNCVMVDKPGKKHNHANWMVDLYNMLSVFFKAN